MIVHWPFPRPCLSSLVTWAIWFGNAYVPEGTYHLMLLGCSVDAEVFSWTQEGTIPCIWFDLFLTFWADSLLVTWFHPHRVCNRAHLVYFVAATVMFQLRSARILACPVMEAADKLQTTFLMPSALNSLYCESQGKRPVIWAVGGASFFFSSQRRLSWVVLYKPMLWRPFLFPLIRKRWLIC